MIYSDMGIMMSAVVADATFFVNIFDHVVITLPTLPSRRKSILVDPRVGTEIIRVLGPVLPVNITSPEVAADSPASLYI